METKEEGALYPKRKSKHDNFDKRLIQEIVREVESGMPTSDAVERYGMHSNTLYEWLKRYGSASYQEQVRRRTYSTSQKRSVVRAVRGGMTLREAMVAFGLSSQKLVWNWLQDFKDENVEISVHKPIEMAKEPTSAAEEEIEKLRQALSEANLKIKALDTLIDIAEENLKIDIRKKPGARQSPK